MANPLKPRRQHLRQKAADELNGRQPDGTATVCCTGVTHAKRHPAIGKAHDAVIGNGNPVGITRQIVEHLGRAAELTRQRSITLDAAFLAHPERFKHVAPFPPEVPIAAWINPPKKKMPTPE